MKIIFVGVMVSVGLLQAQKPTPPPLPPGVVGLPGFSGSGSGKPISNNREVISFGGGGTGSLRPTGSGSASDSPTLIHSSSKWVYCGGQWRQVDRETCQAVFEDPTFADHQSHCSPTGELHQRYTGTSIWLFHPSGSSSFPFQYCAHMPRCFCHACA